MIPSPFLGIGAVHRKFRYGIQDYAALGYSDYTGQNLSRWNNKLVELLVQLSARAHTGGSAPPCDGQSPSPKTRF